MRLLPNRLGWLVAAALGLFVVASITGVVSGGPLDPSGPPAPTRPIVEPRIPIGQPTPGGFPINIAQPGSYYLTENVIGESGQAGVIIAASDVTIDLNGFTIAGVPGASTGISTNSVRNVTIGGGVVRGWPSSGINSAAATHVRISNMTIQGNGALLTPAVVLGEHTVLTDCIVSENDARGINVVGRTSIERCQISDNGAEGITVGGVGSYVANNTINNNGTAFSAAGIWIQGTSLRSVVQRNTLTDNSGLGIHVEGSESTVLSNVARNNGPFPGDNYLIAGICTGCDIAPIQSASAATSPVANISD